MVIRSILILGCLLASSLGIAQTKSFSDGFVYLDQNKNGKLDSGELGVKGVSVSNGLEVIQTDADGYWKLPVRNEEAIFVVKPAGYQVGVKSNQLPKHYFLFDDVEQAAKNKSKLNFPLQRNDEPEQFDVLFWGDPQARGMKEVEYIAHDVVEECLATEARFGVSLGDLVADDPLLMDSISQYIGHIGIPWYNIFGNHDNDRQAKTNQERDDTFERFFGPSTYAFEYGQVVFIALNNIFYGDDGRYSPHFTSEQIAFVKSYLRAVPVDRLVVLMMHAPIIECDNKEAILELIQDRKHSFSISGHAHEQAHLFLDAGQGWRGAEAHHHLVNATVCGSWWCGLKDEFGIPHATMNDGAPNGYSIVSFDENSYKIRFKAARRPADYQMNIYLPEQIDAAKAGEQVVVVNVFAGSEKSVVEMQVNGQGSWFNLEKKDQIDPQSLQVHLLNSYLDLEKGDHKLEDFLGYPMDYPSVSTHMWEGKLPDNLTSGVHKLTVRTKDMFGQEWKAYRLFRVN